MPIAGLEELGELHGARVFVRTDLNVPLEGGRVTDDSRIRASLPTLRWLRERGARVIVASHLGRPGGEIRSELSLRPVAARLAGLLETGVAFASDCVGEGAGEAARELPPGGVLLLENLRFHPGEERNDADFSRALASLTDAYVNDAFGTAHRAHASTAGITEHVPRAAAGRLLQKELAHLEGVRAPERPFLCLLGGAKVSDKLGVLETLASHADVLAIGGAMAYTFLRARGQATGNSLVEEDRLEDARRVVEAAAQAGKRLLLPIDHRVARRIAADAETRVTKEIPEGWIGVDVGPETALRYAEEARAARTIFWNGPMGVFEIHNFAQGTVTVARAVADSSAMSIVGGGDSLAAVNRIGVADRITHLSTGGGASLEFVQGLELPGVTALERAS